MLKEIFKAHHPSKLAIGALWMVGYSLAIGAITGLEKFAQVQAPPFMILFFLHFVALLVITPSFIRAGVKILKTKQPGHHLLRALAGCITYLFFFEAITLVPLTDAVLMHFTAPLFVPMLGWFWGKMRIPKTLWLSIALGFVGIAIELHPDRQVFTPGILFALGSGVALAVVYLAVRQLSRTEPPLRILFYYFMVASLISLPFAVANWVEVDGATWAALIAIGVVMAIGNLFLIYALKRGPAVILSPISFFAIVFSGIIDWIFWGALPGWIWCVGALFVAAGSMWTLIIGHHVGHLK